MNVKNYFIILGLLVVSCKKETLLEREIKSIPLNISEFKDVDTIKKNEKIIGLKLYRTRRDYTEIEFHENGRKKSIHRILNEQCHGDFFDWYENGKVKWKRSYINGNIVGYNNQYDEKGRLINSSTEKPNSWRIINYHDNDTIMSERTQNSLKEFYESGKVKCDYKIDAQTEFVRLYDEKGTLKFDGKYVDGVLFDKTGRFTGKILTYFKTERFLIVKNI